MFTGYYTLLVGVAFALAGIGGFIPIYALYPQI